MKEVNEMLLESIPVLKVESQLALEFLRLPSNISFLHFSTACRPVIDVNDSSHVTLTLEGKGWIWNLGFLISRFFFLQFPDVKSKIIHEAHLCFIYEPEWVEIGVAERACLAYNELHRESGLGGEMRYDIKGFSNGDCYNCGSGRSFFLEEIYNHKKLNKNFANY